MKTRFNDVGEIGVTSVPRFAITSRMSVAETAKLRFSPSILKLLTPTISPNILTSGPPLLPGEIGVVVWR